MVTVLQIYISCSHTMIDCFSILVAVPALQPTVLFLTVLFAIFLRAKLLQILGKGCRRIWHTSAVCIYYGSPPCSKLLLLSGLHILWLSSMLRIIIVKCNVLYCCLKESNWSMPLLFWHSGWVAHSSQGLRYSDALVCIWIKYFRLHKCTRLDYSI